MVLAGSRTNELGAVGATVPRTADTVWMGAIAAALLVTSIYRAAYCGMTHDECGSWQIVIADAGHKNELNHHLLNTWCMALSDRILGNSELALRAHTVIAHAAYLVASVLILRSFRSRVAQFAGFALLNLNPFVLDFFFLARGYGMAMAFQLWSVYLLLRAAGETPGTPVRGRLASAVGCAVMTVVANYAFLNFLLPACGVAVAILMLREGRKGLVGRNGVAVLATATVVACVVGALLYRMFDLRSRGEMYWGGATGFVRDVVGGLVRTWMYEIESPAHTVTAFAWAAVALASGAAALCVWRLASTRRPRGMDWVVMIGAGSVMLTLAQRLVLATPLPIERQALYFVPIFALAVSMTLDELRRPGGRTWVASATALIALAVTVAMVARFGTAFRLHSTLTWRYDASTLEALQLVDSDRLQHFPGQTVDVGNYWHFEPSIRYYRTVRDFAWMTEPTRSPLVHGKHHYIYVMYWQSIDLPKGMYRMVKHFEDSGTALLRAEPATLDAGAAR